MQQAEEPATETEPECTGRFRFVRDGCIVQLQFLEALAQVLEVVAVDGVQTAEHHCLRVAVPGQRVNRLVVQHGDRLAAPCLGHVLDAGDEVAHLARPEFGHRRVGRTARTDLDDVVGGLCLHEEQSRPRREPAVHHAHARHHTAVLVELGIKDESLQCGVRVALWCGDALGDRVEKFGHSLAGLCRDAKDLARGDAEDVLDLGGVAVGFGGGKVDLVEGGDDLQVVLECQVTVGKGLCLDALGGVNHQHHALARGK